MDGAIALFVRALSSMPNAIVGSAQRAAGVTLKLIPAHHRTQYVMPSKSTDV